MNIDINTLVGQAKLDALLRVTSPAAILKIIGIKLREWVDESFNTDGRGKWRPLAPSTVMFRRANSSKPLQDEGHYRASWQVASDHKTWVEIGSSLKTKTGVSLPKIHEFGTAPFRIPRTGMARMLAAQTPTGEWVRFGRVVNHPGIPARPVLPTKEQADRLVQNVVDGMLKRAAANAARSALG